MRMDNRGFFKKISMKNMTLSAIADAIGGKLHKGIGYDEKKEAT